MTSVWTYFRDRMEISYEPEARSGIRVHNSLDELIQELTDVSSDSISTNLPEWRIVAKSATLKFRLFHGLKVEITDVDFDQEKSVITLHMGKSHIGKRKKKAECHTWRNPTAETEGVTLEICNSGNTIVHAGNWKEWSNASVSLKIGLSCTFSKEEYKEMIRRRLEMVIRELTEPCPETEKA